MAGMNSKTAFQLGVDALSNIIHPRKHSCAVDDNLNERTLFLRSFQDILTQASSHAVDDPLSSLEGLMEAARHSDPVSVPDSSDVEGKILDLASCLCSRAKSNEPLPAETIGEIAKLLALRNAICKGAK